MGDVVSDGESFTCPFCTDKVKLGVSSSPFESDSKKLATTSNHSLSAPGAQCIVIPSAPKPCQPNAQNILPGQSPLTIDGSPALGAGCKFMCANGGLLAVSASAQSSTIHDGAAAAEAAAALAASTIAIGSAANDKKEEKIDDDPPEAANDSKAPVGSQRMQLKNAPYQKTRNTPSTINGRSYSGHALDQMQNRGIPTRVVENTITQGKPTTRVVEGKITTNYYDPVNNVTAVTNEKGGVITVGHGKIGRTGK